jgi:hypothetical protein
MGCVGRVNVGRWHIFSYLAQTLTWIRLDGKYGYPNDNAYTLYYLVEWTAFYLVVSLLLLVPNGPPAESTDATADRNEEGGAV